MPPTDNIAAPEEQNTACGSYAATHAMSAKVGDAAKLSHLAASRNRRASEGCNSASSDDIVFELPVGPRRYRRHWNWL